MNTVISYRLSAIRRSPRTGRPFALRTSHFALGVLLTGGVAACGSESDAASAAAADYVQVGVESVVVVASEPITSGPVISGSLRAESEAVVRAETGGSVVAVSAEEGQAVRAGQVLARIEANTQQGGLISAQSAVRSAQRALEVAQRDAERYEALGRAGAVADRDVELARNGVEAARAQLDGARAQLANAQRAVANTRVRAPISGTVSDRPVNAGDVVQPGTPLFTLLNPARMRLEASVPADQLGQVRVGMPVEFTISGYPGRTFTGRIERINPAADAATRQVPIYIALPNEEGTLVAGLFAQGRVRAESRQAMTIPETAVDLASATPTVTRVRAGKVEHAPVRLGIRDGENERVEVLSGVAAGDTLLAGAARGITPGTPVRVQAAAAAAAARQE